MTGFYVKDLLLGILLVLLCLGVCVGIDYADDEPISNIDDSPLEIHDKTIKVLDKGTYVDVNDEDGYFVANSSDKIHTIKTKKKKKKKVEIPTISLWAKPSVRSGYAYKWHYRTWVNYCPNCGGYNCLLINPKGVPERELTCGRCDSDYCGVTGKEKYSWSRVYLRSA